MYLVLAVNIRNVQSYWFFPGSERGSGSRVHMKETDAFIPLNVYLFELIMDTLNIPLKSLVVLAMTDAEVNALRVPGLDGSATKFSLKPRPRAKGEFILMDSFPLDKNSFFNMAVPDLSPLPFQINEDESTDALLRSIQESARVTKDWWARSKVETLSNVEGKTTVVVDVVSELHTVMPDFDTYQGLWGFVSSPLDFDWEGYFTMRFGSFMYLEYAIDSLEEQRDLYRADAITRGSMVYVYFDEFIEKLKKLYWKEAGEVSQISTLLRDVGLGAE